MSRTTYRNRLMTKELTKALRSYPLYSQDAKKKDAVCVAVFRIGCIRWYILEGQKEGYGYTLYGIVIGLQETEYGYFSMNEMADIKVDANALGLGELQVEQDKKFKSRTLAEINDPELQAFLARLYDNDEK